MLENIKFIVSCLFVFSLLACGSKDAKNEDDEEKVKGPAVISKGFTEGTSEVLKENTDYYGVGYYVGKPVKSSSKGWIFNTNEIEVNVGAFGGDFIGDTQYFSIEEDELAREFDQLDRNTVYVFKYEYPHRLNPEIEETHYLIRSWEVLDPNVTFEHRGVETYREKKGSYSSGVRQGKIIGVERWGYWDIDCSVEILLGGIKQFEESSLSIDWMSLMEDQFPFRIESNKISKGNSITMNTYSEESCAFAEKALKAGVYVAFAYSQDYVEFWDRVDRILHKISIIDSADAVDVNEEKDKKKNKEKV